MASVKYQTDTAVLEPQPKLEPANPVVTKGVGVAKEPTPVFLALLAGDTANRGISWYAQPANSTNLISRVRLLMAAEQAILEVHREQANSRGLS